MGARDNQYRVATRAAVFSVKDAIWLRDKLQEEVRGALVWSRRFRQVGDPPNHLRCAADSWHYPMALDCMKVSVSLPDKEPFWNV